MARESNEHILFDILETATWASVTLASRGCNVEQLCILLGPGGVGLSLISAHLNAMYAGLHKFYDPNIFYAD